MGKRIESWVYNTGMDKEYQVSEQSTNATQEARSMTSLAGFVTSIYEENKRLRQESGVEERLLACKYAAKGEYTPGEQAKRVANRLPEVYAPISDTKRRTAKAWMSEILLNTAEKPYEVRHSPLPDMPKEVEAKIAERIIEEYAILFGGQAPSTPEQMQAIEEMAKMRRDEVDNLVREQAEKCAKRMEKVVEDILAEGRWREETAKSIDHVCTYGTTVIKLVNRKRRRLKRTVNKYGVSSFSTDFVEKLELQAVDPLHCFPSKGAENINDGYFCQRMFFQPRELMLMKGQKGHSFDDAIDEVIYNHSISGLRNFETMDTENEGLNNDGAINKQSTIIEGFEFWGCVLGKDLLDQRIEVDNKGNAIDRDKFYEIDCIVVNGLIIYCEMVDERLSRPLFKGVFYNVPGSWWGESLITKMASAQKMANAALTAIAFNMSMASGPMVAITDYERLREKNLEIKPFKTFVFNAPRIGSATDVPIKFFQPSSNSQELLNIYQYCLKDADLLTGIPAYSHGSEIAAGAGRTATGLSILMDNTQRGMKDVSHSYDNDVQRPMIRWIINYQMINNPDESIKGDLEVDSGGLLSILTKDKSIAQLQEVLALCQNPLIANAIGEEGIHYILRRIVSLIPHINPDRVVPTAEEMEYRKLRAQLEQLRMMQMQQQIQMQGQAQAQAAGLVAPPQQGQGGNIPPVQDGNVNVGAMGAPMPQDPMNVTQYQPNQAPQAPMGM